MKKKSKKRLSPIIALCILGIVMIMVPVFVNAQAVEAKYQKAIDKWIPTFQPTVLKPAEQLKELQWFNQASKDLRNMRISVCSESLPTHSYESEVLTKAFEEITGIRVTHEIIDEASVVEKMLTQMTTGKVIYEGFINDSDNKGLHLRAGKTLNLTEYMAGEGKPYTDPYYDLLGDWLNPEFGQDYNGIQYQIADEQFANVYWFRYDWFNRPELKSKFKGKYGYDLGVPVNWSAYFDIAEFFSDLKTLDGHTVYGSMDFGKTENLLGPRFTDSWLSVAGACDLGLPNGLPVDEWGIRVDEKGVPLGSKTSRGGAADSPAAIYAMEAYLKSFQFSPPYAKEGGLIESMSVPSRGEIAQSFFQYTAFLASPAFQDKNSPVMGKDGKPLWRIAPTPHGKYWQEGMKVGYQDAGSWTILKNVTGKARAAAWLYAQFCTSKSIELAKFVVGGTPVRKSTVWSDYATSLDEKFGGLITFYRGPEEKLYTDTGRNVPHYPLLLEQWYREISAAVSGEKTAEEAMRAIAQKMDDVMGKLTLPVLNPKLNPERDEEYWLKQPGAPWEKIVGPYKDGEEMPKTMKYEDIIKLWKVK
jgi:glycerol transport system substrate-binding protein